MQYQSKIAIAVLLIAWPALSSADEASGPAGDLVVDGGLSAARPAALPTGLSSGVAAGFTHGQTLAWGARAGWSTATEYTSSWIVEQSDLKLRLAGALQGRVGRGTVGLRIGVGGTLVHESRTRAEGERAGLSGDELHTTAWRMLPGGDLELVVALRVIGRWATVVSTGPSVHFLAGDARAGWTGSLGVAWQP